MTIPTSVMVVEDEAITQRYLVDILKQLGVERIACFEEGKSAKEAFWKEEFEVVLMDINLDGPMDGIQLARELLHKKEAALIFITAHNDEDTVEEVLELSPFGFIPKPFSAKNVEVTLQVAYKRFVSEKKSETIRAIKQEQSFSDTVTITTEYTYSKSMKMLFRNGEEVRLNSKHQTLVRVLCENINHTVSYDTFLAEIWADSPVADSALRTLVWTLRKQLPDFPIVSQSKIGYMLKSEG